MQKPAAAKEPKDVFFEPIGETKETAKPNHREKFMRFCEENPNDVECRLFDV
jgi:hypothetical protein